MGYRTWIKPGYEFLAFVPILVLVASIAWYLGPVLERLVFVVIHPETGVRTACGGRTSPGRALSSAIRLSSVL